MGHSDIDEGLAQGYLIVAEKYHLGLVFFEYLPLAETGVTRDHDERIIKFLDPGNPFLEGIERWALFHPLDHLREGNHDDEALTAGACFREEIAVSGMEPVKHAKDHTNAGESCHVPILA